MAVDAPSAFWQAAWLLSLLFALERLLAYRDPLALTAFLVAGLLACLTLRRTGDLWFAVGLQAGLDWSMAFLFWMKGLPFTALRPPGALMRVDMSSSHGVCSAGSPPRVQREGCP